MKSKLYIQGKSKSLKHLDLIWNLNMSWTEKVCKNITLKNTLYKYIDSCCYFARLVDRSPPSLGCVPEVGPPWYVHVVFRMVVF